MARRPIKRNQALKGQRPRMGAPQPPIELLPPTKPATAWQRWGPIGLVIILMVAAYIPSIDNDFVSWDDDHYIFDNRQVSEPDGLKSIWGDRLWYSHPKYQRSNEKRVSHQYYPLVFTIYWLEFRLFGGDDTTLVEQKRPVKATRSMTIRENIDAGNMSARGFHVTSIVMHAVNVMLLIFCFRALGFSNWVAWAATILFAVHPLHVASVAWAAERKNIISLMFYLLSMMSYVKMRRSAIGSTRRRVLLYILSLILFQAALFSKTVSLTLPVMLFFTDRLLERRWKPQLVLNSILRVLPFVVLSCLAAWSTIQVEDRQRTIPITESQRPFIPCAALLFYVYKMLLPLKLSPVYPLWQPDPANFVWYLPILGVILIATLIVLYRKKLGSHFIWAVLFYCVIQGPMLGFKNINYFQFAFVAEHYFYHGAVGLFCLLALAANRLRRSVAPPKRGTALVSALVCLAALAFAARTYTYCEVWQTPDSFWRRVIKMNPECWPAYYNTGNARFREAKAEKDPEKRAALCDEAVTNYRRVAEIHKKITQPFDRWIGVRHWQRKWPEAFEAAMAAAQRFPHLPVYHVKAAEFAARIGRTKDSIEQYRIAAKQYERTGDRLVQKSKHCVAKRTYKRALSYAGFALSQNQNDEKLGKTVERIRQKHRQAKERCAGG